MKGSMTRRAYDDGTYKNVRVGVWKEASVVDPPSSGLGDTLRETTTTAGMVLFIIAAASPLAQTLASPVSRSRSMT